MAGEEVEYAQALARLLDVFAATTPGATGREAAAREVENLSRRRSMGYEVDGAVLRADGGGVVPFETFGTEALIHALLSHQVGRMSIRQLTPVKDLLDVAGLLAAPPVDPQGGLAIEEAAATRRLWNVEFIGVSSIDAEPVTASLPPELLTSLCDGADYAMAEAALAKLATRGEKALEEGDARTVGAVLVAMDSFERDSLHDDLRQPCDQAMKRLLSPMSLKLTAQLLPAARQRASLLSVLARMEDLGAEALFAHLVASQSMNERRAYFDAIVELGAGAPMLMEALSDAQWYVARNAAELLGAMRVEGAAICTGVDAAQRRRATSGRGRLGAGPHANAGGALGAECGGQRSFTAGALLRALGAHRPHRGIVGAAAGGGARTKLGRGDQAADHCRAGSARDSRRDPEIDQAAEHDPARPRDDRHDERIPLRLHRGGRHRTRGRRARDDLAVPTRSRSAGPRNGPAALLAAGGVARPRATPASDSIALRRRVP